MNYETYEYEVRVYENGDKRWYQNGKCHRLTTPNGHGAYCKFCGETLA